MAQQPTASPCFPDCVSGSVTKHTHCKPAPTPHSQFQESLKEQIYFRFFANSSPALEKNMWYFHLTRYNKLNTLPPTLQQSVSYSSHVPMILLFMTSQDRRSQSKTLTILETKVGIIRRGLMACGHRLQSGSKIPQDIPPLVRWWSRGHTSASSSNQEMQPGLTSTYRS